MPVTQGSPALNNLAVQLATTLQGGTPARASVGSKDAAFSWTEGLPRGLWDFVATTSVEGSGFNAVKTAISGTPPAVVAPGGTKPAAVTISTAAVPLVKYAGLSTFNAESAWYSDVLPAAVAQTLVAGALMAFETDCIAALAAGAGSTDTTSTTWTAAILGGIGTVAGAGGNPDTLVIGPVDFAKAIVQPTQLQFAGTDPIPTYLGLKLHLSPKATAGTAYVLDGNAVLVGESTQSPSVTVDPFSGANTNTVRIVADLMAACVVTGPAGVKKLTPAITVTEIVDPVGTAPARRK